MSEESQKEILENFIYENEKLEKLEDLLNQFNIFEAIGIEKDEYRHSNFLSWLLDPQENHGLGSYFLEKFLKKTCNLAEIETDVSTIKIDVQDFQGAEVLREEYDIDILIKDESNNFVCAIENKIKSPEGSNQLERYREVLDQEFSDYDKLYIFLTPEGRDPSEDEERDYWIPVSYSEVNDVLSRLIDVKENNLSEDVFLLISHYSKTLERYVMEDSKISELCRKIYNEHSDALKMIEDYKPDKRSKIGEIFEDYIKNSEKLVWDDDSTHVYIKFTTDELDGIVQKKGSSKWSENERILLFEISNKKEYCKLKVIIGPGETEYRDKLFSIAKGHSGVFNNAKGELYDKFKTIYKTPKWLEQEDRRDLSIEEIREKLEKKMDDFKKEVIPEIEEALKDGLNNG